MKMYSYVTSRNMDDIFLPVPAQNSVLREVSNRLGTQYVLPRVEHFYKDSYIELNTLLDTSIENSLIGMYSFLMLPLDLSKLNDISKRLKRKKLKVYFALENCYFENLDDIKNLYRSHICRVMQIKLSPKYKDIRSQVFLIN